MKRLAVLIAAACGLAVGLGSAAIRVYAASVTLTPEQTLALFGEQLPISYWNGTEYVTDVLTYERSGIIKYNKNMYYKEAYWYDNLNETVLIYTMSSAAQNHVTNDQNTDYTVSLNPVIDISNINQIRFSCGFSNSMEYPSGTAFGMSGTAYNKSLFAFYSDYNSDVEQAIVYNFAARDTGSGAIYPMLSYISPLDSNGQNEVDPYNGSPRVFAFSTFQVNLSNSAKKWSWIMNGTTGGSGITQNSMVYPPGLGGTATIDPNWTFYSVPLFFISCPYISEDFIRPETDNSTPEYADDFHAVNSNLSGILDALDLIYEEQQRSRNVLTNAAADINLLQQNVFAMYSDVHGITGDIHSIAGAFSENSLPDIGATHASFDSALDNASRSFDSMAAQDIPQSIENASTGVMGFVWSFIQAFHLDVVFGIVTMLFIVHFVIFRRG